MLRDSKILRDDFEYVCLEFGLISFFFEGGVEFIDDKFILFLVEGDF